MRVYYRTVSGLTLILPLLALVSGGLDALARWRRNTLTGLALFSPI